MIFLLATKGLAVSLYRVMTIAIPNHHGVTWTKEENPTPPASNGPPIHNPNLINEINSKAPLNSTDPVKTYWALLPCRHSLSQLERNSSPFARSTASTRLLRKADKFDLCQAFIDMWPEKKKARLNENLLQYELSICACHLVSTAPPSYSHFRIGSPF